MHATSIVTSWRMARHKPLRPFIGPVKTLLHQRYCFEPCQSHPPLKDAESTTRSGDFWSVLQFSRPRDLRLVFGNLPQSNGQGPLT
jgi:hypothetical protein